MDATVCKLAYVILISCPIALIIGIGLISSDYSNGSGNANGSGVDQTTSAAIAFFVIGAILFVLSIFICCGAACFAKRKRDRKFSLTLSKNFFLFFACGLGGIIHRLLANLNIPFVKPLVEEGAKEVKFEKEDFYTAAALATDPVVFALTESHIGGLTYDEAAARLIRNGPNTIEKASKYNWASHLWHSLSSPFNLLLVGIAVIPYATGDMITGTIIVVMVVLATFTTFFQEFKASNAVEKLSQLVQSKVTVYRRVDESEAVDVFDPAPNNAANENPWIAAGSNHSVDNDEDEPKSRKRSRSRSKSRSKHGAIQLEEESKEDPQSADEDVEDNNNNTDKSVTMVVLHDEDGTKSTYIPATATPHKHKPVSTHSDTDQPEEKKEQQVDDDDDDNDVGTHERSVLHSQVIDRGTFGAMTISGHRRRVKNSPMADFSPPGKAEPKPFNKAPPDVSKLKKMTVFARDLVVGDIIFVCAGDLIPADARLLNDSACIDLQVAQSSMTGESIPVTKNAVLEDNEKAAESLFDQPNLIFMGTNVVSGTGRAVVIGTGTSTYFGTLARTLGKSKPTSAMDNGINNMAKLLISMMFVLSISVLILNGTLAKNDPDPNAQWLAALQFALAVAIGLVPEMLPMIVTVNLATGAVRLSKEKVIVKRLNSIQNFGAMNILCTDKTGTLTEDHVMLEHYLNVNGEKCSRTLEFGFLNSFFQTGLKNVLDKAITIAGSQFNDSWVNGFPNRIKVDELPFDFVRRRMSVVLAIPSTQRSQGSSKVNQGHQSHFIIAKGAVEEMLATCTHFATPSEYTSASVENIAACSTLLTDEKRAECIQLTQRMNESGMRIIAVAVRIIDNIDVNSHKVKYKVEDEKDMTLVGFLAFLDPPKEDAKEAIKILRSQGVMIKCLTGDNELVARNVCTRVGVMSPDDRVVTSKDIKGMSDTELSQVAMACSVFAKLTPSDKERLVTTLQNNGENVVGFMGDGINDSAALKASDVGISVDNAVDIAKESADIILLEKSLMVLELGVRLGRKTFANITKYLKMSASSNFGGMFSALGFSIILPWIPMLPLQLLTNNLLYDLSQIAIPFDNVDDDYVSIPRKWNIRNILKFIIFIGPISSIFDYSTFFIVWFYYGQQNADDPNQVSFFQSAWFVESYLTQAMIVHVIRSPKMPWIETRASIYLVLSTFITMIACLIIANVPSLASPLSLIPLPGFYYVFVVCEITAYLILTQLSKRVFLHFWPNDF